MATMTTGIQPGSVVDTTTAIGRLLITVVVEIVEFEAERIKERQNNGMASAKTRAV